MAPPYTDPRAPRGVSSASEGESRVDARRYLTALRRSRWLIAGIAGLLTLTVLVISLVLPSNYTAEATIVLDVSDPVFGTSDTESVIRQLQTLDSQIDSVTVRAAAAKKLGVSDPDDLEGQFKSEVDPEANLIRISATDRDPDEAAKRANTIATVFIAQDTQRQQDRIREQLAQANAQLAQAPPGEADALRQQIGSLRAQLSSQATELTLVEKAEPPTTPSSPRPLRNAVLALFAGLFIAVIIALARDQLRPSIAGARELSRTTGLPLLAAIPYAGNRFSRNRQVVSAIEHEAYQQLAAGLRLAVPPSEGKLILVTSSVHGEGKTTATARVGRLLAQAGNRTLLVSADLRWPRLHDIFGLPLEPGMTEALDLAARAGVTPELIPATVNRVRSGGIGGELHVLTSGAKPRDPATLLNSEIARDFFATIRELDYDFVLIDAPPLLGIADCQGLAQVADVLILVSRLDRITVDNLTDAMEFLDRQPIETLGHVVIGATIDTSPYFLGDRQAEASAESSSESA